jgi:hypothetical protein
VTSVDGVRTLVDIIIIGPIQVNLVSWAILFLRDFSKSFIWLSMDYSKDNFKNNYLILKLNYFISFLIITFSS